MAEWKMKKQGSILRFSMTGGESECTWAIINFDSENGTMTACTDAGNYAYRWTETGDKFFELMSKVKSDYLIRKISDKNDFDINRFFTELREFEEDNNDNEQKKIIDKAIDDFPREDIGHSYDLTLAYFQDIAGFDDSLWDGYVDVLDYPYQAKSFVRIFTEELQPRLKEYLKAPESADNVIVEFAEKVKKRYNNREYCSKIQKGSAGNFWYSQGTLNGVIKADIFMEEEVYREVHGHYRKEIKLPDMDENTKQALKKVIVKISDITEDHNPDCCAVVICGRSGDHKVIIPRTQAIKPNVLKESCELCARLYLDAAQSQETEYGNWDAENFCGRIRYKDNTEESYEVVKIADHV